MVVLQALPPGAEQVVAQYRELLVDIAVFVGVLGCVYAVGRLLLLPSIVRVVRARNRNNQTIVEAVDLYLRVLFVVLGIPIAVATAGFSGIAAGSGIVLAAATLALGVAGRDVIGNLVSGVFLVADPDFNVGDYIEWADQGGTVEEIDLRVSRVRTPSGAVVVVPNTDLTTGPVTRPFARERYRLEESLSVAYTEDLDSVRRTFAAVVAADERVLADPAPEVHVTNLGESAVEVTAWFWVADPTEVDLAALRTAVRTEATSRFLDQGIVVAPATPQELSGRLAVERVADG